jgi:hypothetical protein
MFTRLRHRKWRASYIENAARGREAGGQRELLGVKSKNGSPAVREPFNRSSMTGSSSARDPFEIARTGN